MSQNPYQAPLYPGVLADRPVVPQRRAALRAVRITATLLFAAAIYNYWEFDRVAFETAPIQFSRLFRAINIGWFFIAALVTWFFSLTILELLSRVLRTLFAPGKDRDEWLDCLYQSLLKTPVLALVGAVLWTVWTFAFYRMHANFYVISWLIGIPAHIVAAAWYVPLLVQWRRLGRG